MSIKEWLQNIVSDESLPDGVLEMRDLKTGELLIRIVNIRTEVEQ